MHTGVQGATGYSEAQIEAGAPGFTHVSGKVMVSRSGTVIDHQWISGCVGVASGATGVTIKDSLITPPDGDYCKGGNRVAQRSAINNGNTGGANGLLVEDTTVDGGNATGDTYGISIHDAECLRCNSFGFAKDIYSGQNLTLQDSYVHDVSVHDNGAHDDPVFLDTSSGNNIQHTYIIGTGSCNCNGGGVAEALAIQLDYGVSNDNTINASYMEGVTNYDAAFGCGSNVKVTNNAFSNNHGVTAAPAAWFNSNNPGMVWSGNYQVDNNTGNIRGSVSAPTGSGAC
jgi:hypothetical protein